MEPLMDAIARKGNGFAIGVLTEDGRIAIFLVVPLRFWVRR